MIYIRIFDEEKSNINFRSNNILSIMEEMSEKN